MNAELRDRSELPRTLAEMEKIPGVTAIIYDQECAAEKRRKRSRGKLAEPALPAGHQRRSLRGLRRLREAVELHEPESGADRVRPEDAHSSVVLQQGL